MNKISSIDIAWLAGMVEGEASFSSTDGGANAKAGYRYPRIEIKSIDPEVLVRIQKITGIGTISSVLRTSPRHQPCWVWRVTDAKNVLHFLSTITNYNFQSDHRKNQTLIAIERCLDILARIESGESYRRPQRMLNGPCSVETCDGDNQKGGYCNAHYNRARRGDDMTVQIIRHKRNRK